MTHQQMYEELLEIRSSLNELSERLYKAGDVILGCHVELKALNSAVSVLLDECNDPD